MAFVKVEPEEILVKEESEELKIVEIFSVKQEDTEEQSGLKYEDTEEQPGLKYEDTEEQPSLKYEDTEEQPELMEESEELSEVEEKHLDEPVEKSLRRSKTKRTFRKNKNKNSFTCTRCGKSFTFKSHLQCHMRIHTRERPFSCDQCGKRFMQLTHLKTHMRVHAGEKPYCCDQCDETFPRASHLRSHLKVHTKKKPHSCSECGKSYSLLEYLHRHMKTHTAVREHKCFECEETFTTAKGLNMHQRIHTGKNTYKCLHCDKRFSLKDHEKIHTGEKPHMCDQCVKSSTIKCNVTENQEQLQEAQRRFQQRVQQKQKDLRWLSEAVESHKCCAQSAVEDSERIFTELIQFVERSRYEFTKWIRDQEKTAVRPAEERLEELEQEINDLRRRDAELEKLSHTQDHINFLQSFQSLSALPQSAAVNENLFSSPSPFDGVIESVHQLRDKVEDFCKEELKKISDRVIFTEIEPKTRSDFLQYSHPLTLDLNTVNKLLRLSQGKRVINGTDTVQLYPDHPNRFDVCQVLCIESVRRRSYWEIEWSGRVCISVSYKSIKRKGRVNKCVFGCNNQSWSLICSPSRFTFIHDRKVTDLSVSSISSRIGVYVDHSEGTLSFYSVSDTMSLIHTVQTIFTRPLYPGFSVLIGSSVKLCYKSE